MTVVDDLVEWLKDREAIHESVEMWPPTCKVTSTMEKPLLCPAPGIVGEVMSYCEDGTIGVAAPILNDLTSPITGQTVKAGEWIKGECDPSSLVLLEYGDVTPDDVRAAIALIKEKVESDG